MLIKILTLSFLVTLQFTCYAQFKLIGQSESFEEMTSGYGKLVILKNDNTVFCSVFRGQLKLQTFSPDHKHLKDFSLNPAVFENKALFIKAIFEVNNDIVLLVITHDHKVPVISRIVIDPANGKIKEEKELARLVSEQSKYKHYVTLAGEDFFHVRKDPQNDQYTIVIKRFEENDVNKQIECLWYSSDHKELARATVNLKDEHLYFLEFLDLVVISDRQLTILINSVRKEKKELSRKVMLGILQKGQTVFKMLPLELTQDLDFTKGKDLVTKSGLLKYNPVTEKIILLTNLKNKDEEGYIPLISYLNINTGFVEFTGLVIPETAIEASASLYGEKSAFRGLPQDIYIGDDGRFTVILEERTALLSERGESTFLGNLSVIYFDVLGGARGSYFIPKSSYLIGSHFEDFYMDKTSLEPVLFLGGHQYKRATYIDGKFGLYIMINDTQKNGEKYKKGRITTINGLGDCDAYNYIIEGADPVPTRTPVFGLSQDKDHHFLGWFPVSAYNKKNNQLVTLRLELEGRRKSVQIVWLEPR